MNNIKIKVKRLKKYLKRHFLGCLFVFTSRLLSTRQLLFLTFFVLGPPLSDFCILVVRRLRIPDDNIHLTLKYSNQHSEIFAPVLESVIVSWHKKSVICVICVICVMTLFDPQRNFWSKKIFSDLIEFRWGLDRKHAYKHFLCGNHCLKPSTWAANGVKNDPRFFQKIRCLFKN